RGQQIAGGGAVEQRHAKLALEGGQPARDGRVFHAQALGRHRLSTDYRLDYRLPTTDYRLWRAIFASFDSMSTRFCSSHGGSFIAPPSAGSSSSAVNPGSIVATSKSTPPGSRK